ncbi:MAG: hypothetical protein CSB06_03395 [Bacteroidia bacterium]|nr:MAG: hypothetical protein CSB06_03395 [Bacteroidia bacterium]
MVQTTNFVSLLNIGTKFDKEPVIIATAFTLNPILCNSLRFVRFLRFLIKTIFISINDLRKNDKQ